MELTRFSHYYLGHKIIDQEHRNIYNALIQMWQTTPPDLIPEQMTETFETVSKHFSNEDKLMIESDYPFIRSHLEVHFGFEERMRFVIMHPTKETLEELITEFLHHIDYYDRPFVDYLIGIRYKFDTAEYLSYQTHN